jgi:DNA-binding GntR family transcriptional regulator
MGESAMIFHSSPVSFLFSPVKLKIAEFVVQNEFSMSERELSRLLGVSHMSVNRTMRELEAMNAVGKVRVGKRLSLCRQSKKHKKSIVLHL